MVKNDDKNKKNIEIFVHTYDESKK